VLELLFEWLVGSFAIDNQLSLLAMLITYAKVKYVTPHHTILKVRELIVFNRPQ